MSSHETAEKIAINTSKWLKIHNELIAKANYAKKKGNHAVELAVCKSAVIRLKNAGLIGRYYVVYEKYWNNRIDLLQSFRTSFSQPMYSRTDKQYKLFQPEIDHIDRFISEAEKSFSDMLYSSAASYLQSYAAMYKRSGEEQSPYDYIRDLIKDIKGSYHDYTYRVVGSILDALEVEPDIDSLITEMKNDMESFCDLPDNFAHFIEEAEAASSRKDFDRELKVCQEALEVLSELNGAFDVKNHVSYWENRKRKIVSGDELKSEQEDNIIEGEAVISRMNQFILDAFRATEIPYVQQLISHIGSYCNLYRKNSRWDESIYDYLESQVDKLHQSEDEKCFTDDFRTIVEMLRHKSNAEVIAWIKENYDSYEVVPWEGWYVYGIEDLRHADEKQKKFYEYFKKEFLYGNCLDLKGNTKYALMLMFDLGEMFKSKDERPKLVKYLSLLASSYPKIGNYPDKIIEEFDKRILKGDTRRIGREGKIVTHWIPLGESVTVAGVKTSRGGFYLGDCLTASGDNYRPHYCSYSSGSSMKFSGPVVNPDLGAKFFQDSPMSVFSSYEDLSMGQRYNFLCFLSGDSDYNTVHKSLLSLYLMGYEFCLFIDKYIGNDEKENLVKELVKMYYSLENTGNTYSAVTNGIRKKIITLIDRALSILRPSNPEKLLGEDFSIIKLPMYSKKILCELRNGAKELSSLKAFEYADKYYHLTKGLPKGEKNYNAVRIRFFELFPENQIVFNYQIHSAYHSYEIEQTEYISQDVYDGFFHSDAEDVCYRIKYPFSNADYNIAFSIQNAVNRIYWDNAKHHELIEANKGQHTPYTDMYYASYIDATEEPTLVKLSKQIDSFADSDGFTNIPVKQFVDWIGYPPRKENGIYKHFAEVITDSLFKMGYGIAPNPLVHGDRLMHEGYCCLYKLADKNGFAKNVYKGQVLVKMAIQVASSDKVIDNDIKLLSEGLKSFGFSGNTYLYLVAFAKQFSSVKQKFYNDKSIVIFTKDENSVIYNLLLRMTFNSGDVSSERVKALKRYSKALGQDPEKIHSNIHAAITDDEFAIVEKTTGAIRYSIPKPGDVKRKFAIDTDKLERIQQQTNEAQELLSDIFADDKLEEKHSEEKKPDVVKSILQKLFKKPVWGFSEVDELCKEFGQMTGFVLEKINDYSYEKVDDAVVEQDGDQIYITVDYKEQLI